MTEDVLKALPREASGKGGARQLRMRGLVPGVFYYRNEINIPLSIELLELKRYLSDKRSLINLEVEGQDVKECVVRDIQRDPLDDTIIHIDLLGIKRGQKLTVTVPLKLQGTPIGVKTGGGILQHSLTEIDIECLPKDIPTQITVDVSHLDIGNAIHVEDLEYEELKFMEDNRVLIASVVAPSVIKTRAEEEAEELEEGEETLEDKEESESSEE